MKKQIKGRYLKISACQFPLPVDKPLDYAEYAVALMVSVDHIGNKDLHEGDKINGEPVMFVDKVYSAKAIGEIVIKDKFDKIYITARKGSQSQLLRNKIRDRNNSDMTGADFYKDIMSVLIDYPDELIELALSLKKGDI